MFWIAKIYIGILRNLFRNSKIVEICTEYLLVGLLTHLVITNSLHLA